ncbi:hypothetical protein GN958_ATG06794 [Phytophthora infestans]|uniref:Uncharacterized protein n=1 Tax=Phytophthora infestans TaxID=4787 RepID=A0A8S9UXT8_PHYIN|nr:hypothetical protein GN958_ATG06794 [Phytophthora infestans]
MAEARVPDPTVSSSSVDVAGLIDQRFNAMMKRQEAQLVQMQMQTQFLAQLIETLKQNNNA